ncbi:NADH-quinone oxidoreductase subunit J [Alkalihalobacillus sp. AL-G]|uniref:NADH-quinone oxidoreductase subunit J n=1 Tax=Alkalihalobacillus sp. AL-G TaxID=2926399 RepID=UPI00272B0EA3|nr:NADH-quinone oxidoreductase subunit J [Alkalihalobacillus sp. AL-G]WLD93147.1 NADH-quinone oxidoreductase subunit J [Alkalihalobacillus sp. AL-G]
MSGELIVFFILALVAIGSGIFMLNLTKVVHMVIALVFTFLSIAGLYVMLSAEFVAFVQVLIYSGAITIIMLFGIMLTRHSDRTESKIGVPRTLLVLVGIVAFFGVMFFQINDLSFGEQATELHVDNTEKIGIELYSKYVIPFELTSVLLLVALVGAIVLAKRDDEEEAKTDE